MKSVRTIVPSVAILALVGIVSADSTLIRSHVEFLASPFLEGRMTGSQGERIAAEYLAAHFRALGMEPLPGHDSFLIPFDFVAGINDLTSSTSVKSSEGVEALFDEDVVALSFSRNGSITAPAVFVGYGIKTPESSETPYDSYHGLDLTGKVAVMLRYFPEATEGELRQNLSRHAGLRYKAMHARELGAEGIIVITGPNSPNAGRTVPAGSDTSVAGSGILAVSASQPVIDALFARREKQLKEVQDALDTGNPHVSGFDFENVEVTLNVELERAREQGHNVVGVLASTSEEPAEGVVLLGAHYDHLGYGRGGSSLAGSDDVIAIHPGADDNASGVATVLEILRDLSTRTLDRPVVAGFWSGEEIGIVGSQAFIDSKVLPAEKIIANLNFDMVGHLRDNRLSLQGTGSSPDWDSILEQANVQPGLDLALGSDPYLPTDATSFYQANVPILSFFTGGHEYYHKPSDTPEKLNYEDMPRIVALARNITMQVANRDERIAYAKVERATPQGGGLGGIRAYTGTIPDYASEAQGLKLSGVMAGGPAEKAGLRANDVIIEFAGQKVANIYDYTYALDAIKIGEPVKVRVQRGEEVVDLELTPEARR